MIQDEQNCHISLYETYSVERGALRNGRCVEDRLIDFCGSGRNAGFIYSELR